MVIVESIAKIGPAVLRFLRALLGLDSGERDASDAERTKEGD
jgi:hypothetical protein